MRVLVYGSRPDGHARVVIEELVAARDFEAVGLIDDYPANEDRRIGELSVLGSGEDLARLASDISVEGLILGFGATEGRAAAMVAATEAGLAMPPLVHDSASVSSSAELSEGVQILARAIVGPGARLGRGALVNSGSIVEHDVVVGDFSVVGPGAVVAGRASIGDAAEIGAGAVILPDVEIGSGAIVGAGAVVTKQVADGETVTGVPARLHG